MAAIILLSLLVNSLMLQATAAEGDNAPEFAVLCQLIRLAQSEIQSLPAKLESEVGKDEELRKAYLIANLTSGNGTLENLREVEGADLKAWLDSVEIPRDPNLRHQMNRRIEVVKKQAEKWEKLVKESVKNFNAARNTSKRHLTRVLYGELVPERATYEAVQQIVDNPASVLAGKEAKIFDSPSDATHSCGGNGDALKGAGKTLINDFYCLCVAARSLGIDKGCNAAIPKNGGSQGWTYSHNDAKIETGWPVLKEQCPKTTSKASPESIHAALAAFRGLFGRSVTTRTNGKDRYVFGTHTGDPKSNLCPRSTSDSCIYYEQPLAGSGIPWENEFLNAINELKEMERQHNLLNHLLNGRKALGLQLELALLQKPVYATFEGNLSASSRAKGATPSGGGDRPQVMQSSPESNVADLVAAKLICSLISLLTFF